MSASYYRVKKWRALKKKNKNQCKQNTSEVHRKVFSNPNIDNSVPENNDPCDESLSVPEVHRNSTDSDSFDSDASNHQSSINSSSNSSFQQNDDILEDVTANRTLSEKLHHWALGNINILTLNVVTQLLTVLREEGHEELPKTAQQLLGTKHCQPMITVLSKRNTTAHYLYIGIKKSLQKIIVPSIYSEKTITVQQYKYGLLF